LISFRPLPCQVFFYFGRLLDDAPLLSFHELLVFLGTYPSCQRDDYLSPGEGGLYTACQAGRQEKVYFPGEKRKEAYMRRMSGHARLSAFLRVIAMSFAAW